MFNAASLGALGPEFFARCTAPVLSPSGWWWPMDEGSSDSSQQKEQLEEAEAFLRVRACLADHEAFAPEPAGILDRRAQQILAQQQQQKQTGQAAQMLPEEHEEQLVQDGVGDDGDVDSSSMMDGSMMALDNSMCFGSPR